MYHYHHDHQNPEENSLASLLSKSAVELAGSTVQAIVRDWAPAHRDDDDKYGGDMATNMVVIWQQIGGDMVTNMVR